MSADSVMDGVVGMGVVILEGGGWFEASISEDEVWVGDRCWSC